ncbi:glycosyltransferase [bacterium]|nr:glycosyltransferase [bacterium]
MKINAISAQSPQALQNARNLSYVSEVSYNARPTGIPILHISFHGNPSKHPEQISAFATESNYLGGIYCAGGLGDVAEALPDSIGIHGEQVAGKKIDMRTFLPYYSMNDNEGRIYVLKPEADVKIKKGEKLDIKEDFILVDQTYKLKDGERFALITQMDGPEKIKKYHLLNDSGLTGTVERMSDKSFDMEKVPYRVFEVDTMGKRQDKMYVIHTYEHGKGKSAYGVFRTHLKEAPKGTTAYGGGGTSAYGGASGTERKMFYNVSKTDDMFYTESMRAYQELTMEGKMNVASQGNFNPQNHMFHDRFCYSALTDITQKAQKGDENYKGLRFVELLHNPGASYQGKYANPLDFFRIIATNDDLAKLKANEHYKKVTEIAEKIDAGKATEEECTKLYKFFKPYFNKFMDSEGLFNMTMLAVSMTDENPQNSNLGNVSKNYGKETRNLETTDIAKGLTQALINIQNKTIDVVNGSRQANMKTDKMGEFFGTGSLNEIFKTKYKPFKQTDTPEVILRAKEENKKTIIDAVANATKNLSSDKDSIAKLFFNDGKINGIRKQAEKNEKDLPLTLGGFSKYEKGDLLFTTWGRPDAQKGLPITLEAFEKMLKDESIPLETRKHCKLIMGAGGGNDAFSGNNPEWKAIKEAMERIQNIEAGGQKGVFKNNAVYVNGLFPNRLANGVDLAIFTSRFEPCGITPFESFATGTPVVSINTGGAPDFVTPGRTGFLTKDPFMLNPEKLGLASDASAEAIDKARKENSSKQVAEQIKAYLEPIKTGQWEAKQKEYIKNCVAEKIEWHNNSAYNGGKSALEIYLKEKFNIADNDIPNEYKSDMRGEFDNSAFCGEGKAGSKISNFFKSKGGKWTIAGAGVAALAGLAYLGHKQGWFSSSYEEKEDKSKHLSAVV